MSEGYQAERMKILEMIEADDITPQDGLRLLDALSGDPPESTPGESSANQLKEPLLRADWETGPAYISQAANEVEAKAPKQENLDAPIDTAPDLGNISWRGWWKYIFWTGAGFMAVGALLLALTIQLNAAPFWYFLAGIPLFFGFFVLILGIISRSSRWIHIRIRQDPGDFPSKIALSFPLPIRPTAWFIRVFGRWVPQLQETGLDELILALGESATPENPLYVQVQDGEDGDQVEVYIG